MTTLTAPAHETTHRAVPEVAICCLGPLGVFVDGHEVPLRPGRARSLLQFLLVHRHAPVPREVVMEAFWPGADPARARSSLNVAAFELGRLLRPVLGDVRVIERVADRCQLNPAVPLWVDAEQLMRLVRMGDVALREGDVPTALGRYEEAAGLYQGDLFSDEPYAAWMEEHRWALQDAALRALHTLCTHHLGAGSMASAAEAARQVLRITPDDEDAHRVLMVSHARMDRRSLALRQYRTLVQRLARLRLDPAPATSALYERVCRGEPV